MTKVEEPPSDVAALMFLSDYFVISCFIFLSIKSCSHYSMFCLTTAVFYSTSSNLTFVLSLILSNCASSVLFVSIKNRFCETRCYITFWNNNLCIPAITFCGGSSMVSSAGSSFLSLRLELSKAPSMTAWTAVTKVSLSFSLF